MSQNSVGTATSSGYDSGQMPGQRFHMYVPFGKVDDQGDGTILVHTVVNDETPDDQGEVVEYQAVKKASSAFMEWANVREMHRADTAAGTVAELAHDDDLKKTDAILHVVDPLAVQKVLTGVYKGTSIGGHKLAFGGMRKMGGRTVRAVSEIDWNEISLVDRPSRPTAVLTLLKRSDPEENMEAETPAAPEPPAPATEPNPEDGGDAIEEEPEAQPEGEEPAVEEPAAPEATEEPETAEKAAGIDVYFDAEGQQIQREPLQKRDFSTDQRKAAAAKGQALPDGSYPIVTVADLKNAIQAYGRAGNKTAVKAHIMKRARALGATDQLPDDWTKVSKTGDLAKSAADDLMDANGIIACIARLIDTEAGEGDTADVGLLKAALASMQKFAGSEAGELGTPDDTAQAAAEQPVPVVVVNDMYYAAVIGDLAKLAIELRKGALSEGQVQKVQSVHDVAHSAGAACEAPEALAKTASDSLLSAMADRVTSSLGGMASKADLDAVRDAFTEALQAQGEVLQKIASTPMPGGPLRYAELDGRFRTLTDGGTGASEVADALEKVSHLPNLDPHVREDLQRYAVAEEIAAQRRGNGAR